MSKKSCYIPVKGIDDVIADKVSGWNKYLVANLRGLYNERFPKEDVPSVEELISFRKSLKKQERKKLLDAINSPEITYLQLEDAFSAEERYNRVSMISTMFSDIVDEARDDNPELSREDIIQGKTGQTNIGGIANIFNTIYEILQEQYSEYTNEGNTEMIQKYQKIFDNWVALVADAKIRLLQTENIKIGQTINFADSGNQNNFDENNLSETYVMEESKRESWQEESDKQSSFGSIGKQVRMVISRLPIYKNGKMMLDDLGYPIMQDPVKIHQELLDVLRGVRSESHMMAVLREYMQASDWVEPLISELEDPLIRTKFLVDFAKAFQPYSIQKETKSKGVSLFETIRINRIKGETSFREFLTKIKLGKSFSGVFEKQGTTTRVIPEKLKTLRQDIVNTLSKDNSNITAKSKFWSMNRADRKSFIQSSLIALGVDVDSETLDKILRKNSDINALNRLLLEAAEFGLTLTKEEQEGKKSISYEQLLKRASTTAKKGALREKITKILAIINRNRENLKLESRARYADNTYFSNVTPSFLGDIMDKISMFAENYDNEGIKGFLENQYLDSSYFRYEGKILNKWIEELYNSDTVKGDSFANNFTYKRFLGNSSNEITLDFENFTSKQHAIQMMNEYFSERQISYKSEYAWYPVFILGDSGVSKFIKAKRYSAEEIIDGLYNVYVQEKRRMELAKAANQKLIGLGYKPIDNIGNYDNKFSLLSFLNEPEYSSMIDNSNLEQSVKKAIKAYMNKATSNFKANLQELGVLKRNKSGQYIYLSQEVNGNTTVDQVIADYFWNTKFATIQQLQMMTIDPSFYKGTKDLQKRYKEIHAPGSILSIEAFDPWRNEKFSVDGKERCVYFDDMKINAEETNSEFMEAIAYHFGRNSEIYESYKENALADGQGYRTLDSYRKVMGMAGKWDERMEAAYNKIKDIREEIRTNENPSKESLRELADLMVTFQPIKPYMFTFENFSVGTDILKIPVQHKYAEAIIIPELLPKGSKLRAIGEWMENHVDNQGNPEPIDMIGSWSTGGDKIVKVGGFGSTNITNSNSSSLIDDLNAGYVHVLNYSDYRIQTNVPEHINSSQLFGTQVRKLIMAGVKLYNDYSKYVGGKQVNIGGKYGKVNLNGRNLIRFYNSLIVANILHSQHKFERAISSNSEISERLIQSTANNTRESKDNILSYALDENGDFNVPLFEGALEHDSSALLFSLFKKIVNKQSIKGGSAVQVSAMGIDGYKEDGGLAFVASDKDGNIIRSTDPDYESKKGSITNILYAECEIPFDLSYTDASGNEHQLNFEDWCNEDGTLKTDKDGNTLIEKQYPGILDIMAYRIPTERAYSMMNLKVKRFSSKTAGGTIKVPPQGTTIAGFDFDIDKLYFMRYEFKYSELTNEQIEKAWKDFYKDNPDLYRELLELREADEGIGKLISDLLSIEVSETERLYKYKEGVQEQFSSWLSNKLTKYSSLESYDFDKAPLDNTPIARNNMLLSLIRQRLMDEETFKERYTPGGFTKASKAARLMRELIFGNVSRFISGKKIDLSEVKDNIANTKDPEPNYDPSDPNTIIVYNQQNQVAGKLIGIFANQNVNHAFASLMSSFKLKVPITFAGHSESDLLHKDNLDKLEEVNSNVAEFLAASVDAVKDPVLNFLNLNTITADAGAVLARLGFNTEEIGLLFNQPIIKEICEYSFNNNISDTDTVINSVLKNYIDTDGSVLIPSENFSKETLAYNIVKARTSPREAWIKDSNFVQHQVYIAELFKSILGATDDISNFVRNTKFTASNAVGSTYGHMYSQQMKVKKYVESFGNKKKLKVEIKVADFVDTPLSNSEDILYMSDQDYMESLIDNPLAYEQAMYDMNRKALNKLNEFYPYNTKAYSKVREFMSTLTRSGILQAETINQIHSDLIVYMLSQKEGSLFSANTLVNFKGRKVSAREYFTKLFPEYLYSIIEDNPVLKSKTIFQYMHFDSNEDTGDTSINIQDVGGLNPHQKDEIKESWRDLVDSEYSEIAESLFMYNYYKLGFTFSPFSFMNLAPTKLKRAIKVGGDYNGNAVSYIDFLKAVKNENYEIMSEPNTEDFAKQFILNHLDDYNFSFTPKGDLKKIVDGLAYKDNISQDKFTLDAEKLGADANAFLLPSSDKKVHNFRPVLIIDGLVYMCQNEESDLPFNSSSYSSITYYKVEPLGNTNISLQYTMNSDNYTGETFNSSEDFVGSTSIEPEISGVEFDKEAVITEIAEEIGNALDAIGYQDEYGMAFSRKAYAENLKMAPDEEVKSMIEAIRKGCRENGVLMLDSEGNIMQGC